MRPQSLQQGTMILFKDPSDPIPSRPGIVMQPTGSVDNPAATIKVFGFGTTSGDEDRLLFNIPTYPIMYGNTPYKKIKRWAEQAPQGPISTPA